MSELREASVRAKTGGSLERYQRAVQSLAGGVSSGLRRQARPYPLYFERGCGARVSDVDGNVYIDYGLAWGPLILGHAPAEIVAAVSAQLQRGFTFGAQHDLEIEVAEALTAVLPCAERVVFANSGTEIVQLALRLARAHTGRLRFVKFEGHYHGWDDSVLVSYHPTDEEICAAGSSPIPVGQGQRTSEAVLIAQWNDEDTLRVLFERYGEEIAAVICEPMLCNSGCIPPDPGFLEFLRNVTRDYGAVLIFDEVITGFRLGLSGAQGYYGVIPDLATYAKAVGAGLPLSVLGGRAEFMDRIAHGTVVHAGTLNGNPVVLAAAGRAIEILSRNNGGIYSTMHQRGERLKQGLERILRDRGHAVVTQGCGTVFQFSFMDRPARNYRDTLAANRAMYSDFALALLDEGVLVLPDGRWYISAIHDDASIDLTLAAAERAARDN
jgi:glutamate-1-semialdehyde 2,1-aminomutase